jgi:hypothetical protein
MVQIGIYIAERWNLQTKKLSNVTIIILPYFDWMWYIFLINKILLAELGIVNYVISVKLLVTRVKCTILSAFS